MDIEYIINSSLCRHCENRVSRVVSVEGLFVQYEDEECEDLENFIHESCLLLCIELDHIVLECSKFKDIGVSNSSSNLLVNPEIINDLA